MPYSAPYPETTKLITNSNRSVTKEIRLSDATSTSLFDAIFHIRRKSRDPILSSCTHVEV
eukprot:9482600-Pyramimonas_sp.AAC.1